MRRGIAECPIQLCVQCWPVVQGAPGLVGAVYHPCPATGAHVVMPPVPCTLYPVPCTLYPVPCILYYPVLGREDAPDPVPTFTGLLDCDHVQ